MNISRRLMLGGLATALAASITRLDLDDNTPVLIGDGVHDDAPALNAWLKGEPIRFSTKARAAVVGGASQMNIIRHATLAIRAPIIVPQRAKLLMEGCNVVALPDYQGKYLLEFSRGASDSHISRCYFDSRNMV